MKETYNYYCQYCGQFWDLDTVISLVCPKCKEYKGLVAVTEEEEL